MTPKPRQLFFFFLQLLFIFSFLPAQQKADFSGGDKPVVRRRVVRQTLKGGVLQVSKPITQDLYYDREGRLLKKIQLSEDELGNIVQITRGYNWRGDTLITNRLDEFGRRGESKKEHRDSSLNIAVYQDGKIQVEATFIPGTSKVITGGRSYSYNADGTLRRIVVRDYFNGQIEQRFIDHSYKNGKLSRRMRYQLDESNHVVFETGTQIFRDEKGLKVKEILTRYGMDSRQSVSEIEYGYNKKHKNSSKIYREEGKEQSRVEYLFNEKTSRIIEENVYRKGQLKDRFIYEYSFFN